MWVDVITLQRRGVVVTVSKELHVSDTWKPTRRGLGTRVTRVRKERGFRSQEAFAAHLSSDNVTLDVIRNLESGRVSDLRVSQLLEIANGLRVTPLVLLFDMSDPFSTTDLVGLPPVLARRTHEELEYWTAMHAENPTFNEVPELLSHDEGALVLLRQLRKVAAKVARLHHYAELHRIANRVLKEKRSYSTVRLRTARAVQDGLTRAMREDGMQLPDNVEWGGRRLSP